MEKKRNIKYYKDIFYICLVICSLFLIGGGVYLFFFSDEAKETQEGYARQQEEETIADSYLEYLLQLAQEEADGNEGEAGSSNSAGGSETEPAETEPTLTMDDLYAIVEDDPNYYERDGVTYTPDYAQGYLAFVLEVPTAGIKRGVYGGTWDEIYYDLDIWMVTLARPDYELGNTHLCIYGHNHTAQDLSFNNLYKVQVGDEFYIYAESGYYRYEVTAFFADWRSSITQNYVDNFSIGADKCYILTCGRNEYRYKDIAVEGTLAEHLTLKEYAERLAQQEE